MKTPLEGDTSKLLPAERFSSFQDPEHFFKAANKVNECAIIDFEAFS
jgi:hypothetical protein